jgi:hypothetical protein
VVELICHSVVALITVVNAGNQNEEKPETMKDPDTVIVVASLVLGVQIVDVSEVGITCEVASEVIWEVESPSDNWRDETSAEVDAVAENQSDLSEVNEGVKVKF